MEISMGARTAVVPAKAGSACLGASYLCVIGGAREVRFSPRWDGRDGRDGWHLPPRDGHTFRTCRNQRRPSTSGG